MALLMVPCVCFESGKYRPDVGRNCYSLHRLDAKQGRLHSSVTARAQYGTRGIDGTVPTRFRAGQALEVKTVLSFGSDRQRPLRLTPYWQAWSYPVLVAGGF